MIDVVTTCGTVSELQLQVAWNGVNYSNITVGEDLIGETITLSCVSTNGSSDYAMLEWLDGELPIPQLLGNRGVERRGNAVFLDIRNFTVDNYGQYRCRCVNDYSQLPLFSLKENLLYNTISAITYPDLCSAKEYVFDLLPNDYSVLGTESRLITEVGEVVSLSCVSGKWSISRARSEIQYLQNQYTLNITVSKSADQAKAVCFGSGNMLERIFYISIKDYHQLPPRFIRPSDDGIREIVFDLNNTEFSILCMLQYNENVKLYMSRNGGENVSINDQIDAISVGGSYPQLPVQYLYLFRFLEPIAPNERVASEWYNSTFSCRTEGVVWDAEVETEFRLIRPGKVVASLAINLLTGQRL